MYKILGGDGKEYGPVSADTLRGWVNEGRANAQTQVQADGATGWTALGMVPEFADLFSAPVAPVGAPPLSGSVPPGMPASIPPTSSSAGQMVIGPAIGLIVTAALGALAQILGLIGNILGTGIGMMGASAQGQQDMPAWMHAMTGGLGIVFNIIALIMSVVVFMGAMKMKKLENFNFALTATIVAMVPCVSPCCWVGLPIGIWALVVLMKPEVKGAFTNAG
jgi:hypothetical protein